VPADNRTPLSNAFQDFEWWLGAYFEVTALMVAGRNLSVMHIAAVTEQLDRARVLFSSLARQAYERKQ
jgi:hypothetical protein